MQHADIGLVDRSRLGSSLDMERSRPPPMSCRNQLICFAVRLVEKHALSQAARPQSLYWARKEVGSGRPVDSLCAV